MQSFRNKVCAVLAVVLIACIIAPSAAAGYDLTVPADTEWNAQNEQETPPDKNVLLEQAANELVSAFETSQQDMQTVLDAVEEYDSPAEVEIIVDGRDADTEYLAFIWNGATYAPVRGLCEALGASEVTYDGNARKVNVKAEGLSMTLYLDKPFLVANGRYLYVPDGFTMKGDRVMAPVRTVCRAFGAEIVWDEEDAAAIITSGGTPILSGDEFYDEDEVYWMTRIIHAEAGCEPFLGKIAVGNVIMNRVASGEFPNNVYDVIFDRKNGVQFTPTVDGSIYRAPDDIGCEEAAKLSLEGTDVIGDAMYFSSASVSCWAKRNRPYATQIGSHAFFL